MVQLQDFLLSCLKFFADTREALWLIVSLMAAELVFKLSVFLWATRWLNVVVKSGEVKSGEEKERAREFTGLLNQRGLQGHEGSNPSSSSTQAVPEEIQRRKRLDDFAGFREFRDDNYL